MKICALIFLILIAWIEARHLYEYALARGDTFNIAATAGLVWGGAIILAALTLRGDL